MCLEHIEQNENIFLLHIQLGLVMIYGHKCLGITAVTHEKITSVSVISAIISSSLKTLIS